MKKILLLVMVVLVSSIALADKEVKTITYSGGFVADAGAGTPYNKSFNFVSPDGITNLLYAKGILRLDTTEANTRVYAQVDGEFCTPSYYDIPTVEKSYNIIFDCTDVAHGQGEYVAGFQSNKDIENVYAEWEFTYLNNPEVDVDKVHDIVGRELELFGTEYMAGANATAWLQLLDNESVSVRNASCLLYVYYPDKSPLLTSTPMSYLEHGVYYYDFAVPEYEGVYIMTANCGFLIRHLVTNTATDFVIINGTEQSGSYTDTNTSDDTRHELIEETDSELPNLLAFYNFTAGNISIADVLELDIHVEYQWKYWLLFFYSPAPEVLNLEIYNYSSASWYRIPQNLSGSTTDTNFDYAITGNITHFVQNDTVQLRFIDVTVDATQDQLWIDHMYVECIGRDSQYTELKGANELHVNPSYPETNYTWFEEQFNATAINYTWFQERFNITWEDITGIPTEVWNYDNRSVATGQQWVGGTEYSQDEATGLIVIRALNILGDPVEDAQCNLTVLYPNLTMFMNQTGMIQADIKDGVYYLNFSLPSPAVLGVYPYAVNCVKEFQDYFMLGTFHVFGVNRTLNAEEVWSYPSRNLTYYEDVTNYTWLENEFDYLELSMVNNFSYTNSLILGINGSIFGKLIDIENYLGEINVSIGEIQLNLTELDTLIRAVNLTIMNKLYDVQDEIVSVNNTVLAINQSIIDALDEIDFNTTELENLILSVNGSVYAVNQSIIAEIQALNLTCPECQNLTVNLTDLENLILSVNSTVADYGDEIIALIGDVNVSIEAHLDIIEQKIDNLTFLVGNLNITIGNLSLNCTIPDLMNLTNSSITAVGDEIIIKMLEHARILNDRVVNFHNNEYCIDNVTLQHNVTYEYCIGNNCRILSDIMDETCDYGCDVARNECIPSPDVRWMYVGVFVLVMALVIVLFKRYA